MTLKWIKLPNNFNTNNWLYFWTYDYVKNHINDYQINDYQISDYHKL